MEEGGHNLGVVFEGDECFAFCFGGRGACGRGGGGGGGGICHDCDLIGSERFDDGMMLRCRCRVDSFSVLR